MREDSTETMNKRLKKITTPFALPVRSRGNCKYINAKTSINGALPTLNLNVSVQLYNENCYIESFYSKVPIVMVKVARSSHFRN